MHKFSLLTVWLLATLAWGGPGHSGHGAARAEDDPAPETSLKALLGKADELYAGQRSSNSVVKEIDELLAEALKVGGETYAVTWRMARAQWWKADGAAGNEALMEKEAKVGWDWAKKAVALDPNRVEGHFWLAANIGQYSLAVGVLRALANGLEGKFLEPLEESIKMNSMYEDAAPIRTKGTYHLNLPWPKQDLEEAIRLLKKASSMAPRGIRNHWYLAQAYEEDDNIRAAIAEIDIILRATAASSDPGDLPRLQRWARAKKPLLQAEL